MESIDCQTIGREFVKQYYTMLNKAPQFQHRFYSSVSSYVHGGIEKPGEELPPVIGQAEINQKILSLNFVDCRTKIRQVDSQKTLGNGILIQVAGEISNAGQPMRRFMQTFVLGYQSAKNYYVHNDVFRYQDEMFYDDVEIQGTVRVDVSNELTDGAGSPPIAPKEEEQVPSVAASVFSENADTPVPPNDSSKSQPAEQKDALAAQSALKESQVTAAKCDSPAIPESPNEVKVQLPSKAFAHSPSAADDAKPPISASSSGTTVGEPDQRNKEPLQKESPGKPLSWAEMAASVGPVKTPVSLPRALTKPSVPKADQTATVDSGPNGSRPMTPKSPPQRLPVDNHRVSADREGSVAGSESSERLQMHYPDDQQVFVGNLPHSLSETVLRKFLEGYGPVVDLRIHRNSSNNNVPNYGFVIFENRETVQVVLENKPLICDNHRINVEEKMRTDRPGSGRGGRGGGSYRGRGRGNWTRTPRN